MEKNVSLLQEISSKFTEETLKNILVKVTGKESAQVAGWNFEPGSSKGDNYLSIIYRVTVHGIVDGINTQIKVVIKGLPHNEATRKTFRSIEFFSNEINFYSKVIPALEKFLESKNQKDFLPIPKCLEYHCDGQNDFLVLVDARELGYGHIHRHDIWKVEEIQVTLTSLARFHAVSFAYQDQDPTEFAKIPGYLSETYFSDKHWDWYEKLFTSCVDVGKDAISREYKGSREEKKFLSILPEDIYKKSNSCMPNEPTPTAVITQGDSWPANFMIRMDKETGDREAMLLDFQLARYTSPVTDISNFIYTSTDKEIREKHFNSLLKYYHSELSRYLITLGSIPQNVYSLDLFMAEIKKNFVVGFCFSLEGLPVMMLDESEAYETENISGTEGVNVAEIIKVKPIESKDKRRRLADMIVHAVQLEFI